MPEGKYSMGVWVSHEQGDVHNYFWRDNQAVIGWNKSYKDKVDFSDLALVVDKDAKISLQFDAGDGKPVHVKVSEKTWAEAVLAMLEGLKAKAVKMLGDENKI